MTTSHDFYAHLAQELQGIRDAGLYKGERIIATPQGAHIRTVAPDGTHARGAQPVRQQLPGPVVASGRDRGGARGAAHAMATA